jgi:hypothetical protein
MDLETAQLRESADLTDHLEKSRFCKGAEVKELKAKVPKVEPDQK